MTKGRLRVLAELQAEAERDGEYELKVTRCECSAKYQVGVQYRLTSEDYDGVSEWRCDHCGKRWGRWTKKELKEGELEKRYGGRE